MNTIELQGQIKSIYEGKQNTVVTIYTRSRRSNFPQVIFSMGRRSLVEDFVEGDYVKISGLLKTRGIRQEDGKILHEQFIRGEDIVFMDAPGEDEEFEYVNEGELVGEIVRSTAGNHMVTLLVRPEGEKFNVWVFKYTDEPEAAAQELAVGSTISAKCEMQTVRKEINGQVKYFENFVILESEVR